LVGGSTRMPMVVEMLRKLTGIEPDHTVNPDEAVARGAALYAAYLLAQEDRGDTQADLTITNVNSHSLGIEGIDPETLRKTNVVLIPRNTSLPATITERLATKAENQRSIVVQVLEGENASPDACTAIGRTVIRNLPEGLPKHWPVEVTFEYGANGRLKVRAVVPGTERGAALELERAAGLSSDGLARWKQPVAAAAGFQSFESLVDDAPDEPETTDCDAGVSPADAFDAVARQPSHWMPFAATGQPSGDVATARSVGKPSAAKAWRPHWVFNVIGHGISSLVGLGLGYWLLHWFRPASFPWPW
jgi:hypothetical protein